MTALPNIPRLYTALAECLAVGIYALPLGIRFGKTATIAASAAWALALSAFLQATGSVPLAWWIPCMAAAVGIQYLYLWVTRTISLLEAGYVCARAFVLAELAASISEHGLLQPIAVRPHGVDRYLIVAGERRWRACRMAGLTEAPVVVKDVTDEQAMELALVENLQREDLDPVEEALGIRELMTRCDLTQEQAARKQRTGQQPASAQPAGNGAGAAEERFSHHGPRKGGAGPAHPGAAGAGGTDHCRP